MPYSRAYQEVIAGRVREDEQIAFYGKNKIALPPRVTSFNNLSAQKEPKLSVDVLGNEFVGKAVVFGGVTDPKRNISAYNPTKLQLS
jgi:hypothetical protein